MNAEQSAPTPLATRLIGPNPKGATRRLSLAVREALRVIEPYGCDAILAVACSGGPDSLALLAATVDQAHRTGNQVHSFTVDHGIRPGSDKEAEQVAKLAQKLGATTAQVLSIKPQKDSLGPEGGAREGRYQALKRACRVLEKALEKPVFLLFGHTMDDQAETVLLGLGRGSGLRSIAGMEPLAEPEGPNLPWIMRPLLQIRRTDTVLTCKHLGLQPVMDPTNRADGPWRTADGSALRRAAVREFAMPALANALGQDPTAALMRTATQMRRDNECLDLVSKQLLEQVRLSPGVSSYTGRQAKVDLDWQELQGMHPALVTRVVRFAALEAGATPAALNSVHIETLTNLVLDYTGQGPVYLPGGVVVSRVRLDKPTPKGRPGLTIATPSAPIRLRYS
ncbi:tRNA lysidine(34) synthetase TilS [Actinomycetaceae bacterium TAE3-ERU4]|nr:tRNA lysidine(34) synthetase TilS [Actinomycetaceae bacterium TAE3-ERU4]